MVVKRVVTGLLIAVVIVFTIWFGEPVLTVLACAAAGWAAFEFYRIVKSEHIHPLMYFGIAFSVLLVLNAHSPWPFTLPLIFVLITLIPLIWMLFRHNKDNSFINWGWTVAGILYTGWLLSFYVSLRAMDNGMGWLFLVLGCTALSDVFAYAVGSTVGKHAMASSVSPGKTWEGSAGGMAGSIACAVAMGFIFQLPLAVWQMVTAGIIIGVFSQIGDLVESLLKRNMRAKDAGTVLPGHGGILDRIDSHLLIAPVAYYLIFLISSQGWLLK
jgi:phosphatidate cytidylyltransferase